MLRNLCDFARTWPNWPESRLWQRIRVNMARHAVGNGLITRQVPGARQAPDATMLGTAADRAAKTPGPVRPAA
ncbi:hypothetical protein CBM2599_A10072 [Cupriavidus taiwanensis]|uniref:Uncharacterized protein n=1 Tax=Cupriavidus taiwanensis TaxID=164546 RepID=A0A976AIX1_9BURK|nr:hypothetical protein CBM2599_A10072 [Cupriavidus taiwanensis]SOY87800.1 hypothetical protein CBM2600_A170072 [Cupriavidus taiwanensis]SPD66175.1 protein of unknown function [Cupriavidus taiwanensis]